MIIDILRHTPVWVFGILAALVALGIRRLSAREVSTRQLLALPIVMSLLSLFGLHQAFGLQPLAFGIWLLVVAASLVTGAVLPQNDGVRAVVSVQQSSASRRIRVPGSRVPLALMMIIFFLRYVAAVSLAVHPSLRVDPAFVVAIAVAYGLSSGIFAARALHTWNSAFRRGSDEAPIAAVA